MKNVVKNGVEDGVEDGVENGEDEVGKQIKEDDGSERGDGTEKEIQVEEGECGSRRIVKMQDPRKPSVEEVEEHEKSHLAYRS